jgi:hypothetical protein
MGFSPKERMRTLRFLTLMLAALSMGMAFSHLLEMPAKLAYQGPVWLMLQQTLYGNFRILGLLLETGAVACALALTLFVRGPAFGYTVFAAICLVAAHAAWWAGAAPVNAAMAQLTPQTLPPDWGVLRAQWEYTHAARAVLQIAALAALVLSLLAEIRARARALFS